MKYLFTLIIAIGLLNSPTYARPKYLGVVLTIQKIKANFPQYVIEKGDYERYNDNSVLKDGKITFKDGSITYSLETDYTGKVFIEGLKSYPKTMSEMNSLINIYKAEGSITKDENEGTYRKIALYVTKTENVIISSDITGLWSQNSLGRQWDFTFTVTYILTTRY